MRGQRRLDGRVDVVLDTLALVAVAGLLEGASVAAGAAEVDLQHGVTE